MTESRSNENTPPAALEPIAMAALDAGRLLMESGASAHNVDALVAQVARGLGADRVDLRIGYASLAITVGVGDNGITRMRKVGPIGVNLRLDRAVKQLANRVQLGGLTPEQTSDELERLAREIPRHSAIFTAVAVGLACAAFGRLLKADWLATGPIFVGATIAQLVRRAMAARHVNVFIGAAVIAFVGSVIGGFGARLAGSHTVATAMIAAILLLVPGVPSLNAQNDILDGRPTLGSARSVWVVVILIFATVGLWLGQVLLREGQGNAGAGEANSLLHQTLCGAIAAAGFGILFNIGLRSLAWCTLSGALALAVRTICLDQGWSLEAASFVAALAVGSAVRVLCAYAEISQDALDVCGCIPMVPGSFAAKAILGLFALTSPSLMSGTDTLMTAVEYTLRVLFTIGAIGTGLAIPMLLLRVRLGKAS
ncbi:MAG: hypothetical protein RLY20_3397 [Verrucomicrobiota bacterium]|jgi:uncharacterized membrane protein YjjP (DUF1212 family)